MPKKQRHSRPSTPPPSFLPLRRLLLRANPLAFASIPLPGWTIVRKHSPSPFAAKTPKGGSARRPPTKSRTPRSPTSSSEGSLDDESPSRGPSRARAARTPRKRLTAVSSARGRTAKTESVTHKPRTKARARSSSSSPSRSPARRRPRARAGCADRRDDPRFADSSSDDSSELSSVAVSSDSDGEAIEAPRVRVSSKSSGGNGSTPANARKRGINASDNADVDEAQTSQPLRKRRKSPAQRSLEKTEGSHTAEDSDDVSLEARLKTLGRPATSLSPTPVLNNPELGEDSDDAPLQKRALQLLGKGSGVPPLSTLADNLDDTYLQHMVDAQMRPSSNVSPTPVLKLLSSRELGEDSDEVLLQKRAAALLQPEINALPLNTPIKDSVGAPSEQRAPPLRSDELIADALGDAESLQHGLNSPIIQQNAELGVPASLQPEIDALSDEALAENPDIAPLQQRADSSTHLREDQLFDDELSDSPDAASLQYSPLGQQISADIAGMVSSQNEVDELSVESVAEDSHAAPLPQEAQALLKGEITRDQGDRVEVLRQIELGEDCIAASSNGLGTVDEDLATQYASAPPTDDDGAAPFTAFHSTLASRIVSETPSLVGETQQSVHPLPSPPVELELISDCAELPIRDAAAGAVQETDVIYAQHSGQDQGSAGRVEKAQAESIVVPSEKNCESTGHFVSSPDQPHELKSLVNAPAKDVGPVAIHVDVGFVPTQGSSAPASSSPTIKPAIRPLFRDSRSPAGRPSSRATALQASPNSIHEKIAESSKVSTETMSLPCARPVLICDPAAEGLFLQTTICKSKAVASFQKCSPCVAKKGEPCRFIHFRALCVDPATGLPSDVPRFRSETPTREWAREVVFPAGVTAWPRMVDFLEYQLFFVKDAFLETVDKELDHVTRMGAPPHCVKAPVAGTRQTCDYCEQGIYNAYYMCMRCGKDICLLCADEGWGPKAAVTTPKSHPDGGPAATNIHRCTYRRRHGLETFLLVGRWSIEQMKVAREWMVGWYETHGQRLRQQISARVYEPPPSRTLSAPPHPEAATATTEIPHMDALIDAPHPDLLIVRAHELTLGLFQQCWRDRKAVFVTDMAVRLQEGWSPAAFRASAGSDHATLIDVVSGELHPDSPLGPFFDGFGGHNCVGDTDPVNDPSQEPRQTLKLKDWPTDMLFRQKLPEICARLLDVLPAPAYTLPDGALNLAAAIPSEDVPPDLGPKLYAAYGYDPGHTGATTNLHLDVADAANVMVWSQPHVRQKDPSTPPHRFNGAIWELFPPASLTKLRTYLRETYAPRPARIDDPIHDQTAYLHPHHLAELRVLHDVTPIRLHQRPGDVVFVPAGFAHQVANYGDCIKAAVDFVSPEGMRVCDALCSEFRRLGKGHGRRGDTVCVGKIAWSVVRKAVMETSRASTTACGG
ncbi:putative JmjC domain-containing histone demethylation protein 2C [Geranomyces variabilis]|nr:putative JmjC domain-containing histone demethylation protein 2C [Geranomyces variabilis]